MQTSTPAVARVSQVCVKHTETGKNGSSPPFWIFKERKKLWIHVSVCSETERERENDRVRERERAG